MLKLEYHIQFISVFTRIFLCFFNCNSSCFTNCHDIIFWKDFMIHFLKKFMDSWTMYAIWSKIAIKSVIHFSIRKSLIFGNHTDNIHTETINSFFTPEFHHIVNFLAYFFIFPIEIRLFFWKQMQIIHLCLRIIFPCRTAECSSPVIRFFSVYRVFPDIIITIWIIFWLAAFNKPVMFIRCMIDYKIHQNPDGSFVCFTQQFLIILHSSIFFINSTVIRNIITIIVLRWFQHRRNP